MGGQAVQEHVISYNEIVELVPVDSDVPLAFRFPNVLLINRHSHQVRHDVGQPVIVIPFHPDYLHVSLWIG